MDIRLFMKGKSISDNRSVENISDKSLRTEVQSVQTKWGRKGKAFCERPFALHRQQSEKDKQNLDVATPGKISADAHGVKHYLLNAFCRNKRFLGKPLVFSVMCSL